VWNAVNAATRYNVQVSTNSTFAPLFHSDNTTALQKAYTDFPHTGAKYFWRARAYNTTGYGAWSAVRNFINP
jgi:hypothetical protein